MIAKKKKKGQYLPIKIGQPINLPFSSLGHLRPFCNIWIRAKLLFSRPLSIMFKYDKSNVQIMWALCWSGSRWHHAVLLGPDDTEIHQCRADLAAQWKHLLADPLSAGQVVLWWGDLNNSEWENKSLECQITSVVIFLFWFHFFCGGGKGRVGSGRSSLIISALTLNS